MHAVWADETVPPPRSLTMRLECDGDHGLFPPPVLELPLPPTTITWDLARRHGWRCGPGFDLCPECVGRAPRQAEEE